MTEDDVYSAQLSKGVTLVCSARDTRALCIMMTDCGYSSLRELVATALCRFSNQNIWDVNKPIVDMSHYIASLRTARSGKRFFIPCTLQEYRALEQISVQRGYRSKPDYIRDAINSFAGKNVLSFEMSKYKDTISRNIFSNDTRNNDGSLNPQDIRATDKPTAEQQPSQTLDRNEEISQKLKIFVRDMAKFYSKFAVVSGVLHSASLIMRNYGRADISDVIDNNADILYRVSLTPDTNNGGSVIAVYGSLDTLVKTIGANEKYALGVTLLKDAIKALDTKVNFNLINNKNEVKP